jgi:WhiB family redox-sensing transcriptional regulator
MASGFTGGLRGERPLGGASTRNSRIRSRLEAPVVAIEPLIPVAPVTDDWMVHGSCKTKTHLFFAPQAERPQARVRREAKARVICAACPVLDVCRAFARAHREYGFWGGESEEERHRAGFKVAAPIGVRAGAGLSRPA